MRAWPSAERRSGLAGDLAPPKPSRARAANTTTQPNGVPSSPSLDFGLDRCGRGRHASRPGGGCARGGLGSDTPRESFRPALGGCAAGQHFLTD